MKIRQHWHPLHDPHHCCFRLISVLAEIPAHKISIPKLSILDLFHLFPHYLRDISLPREVKSLLTELDVPYKKDSFIYMPDLKMIYRDLQELQRVAIANLLGRDIFSLEEYKNSNAALLKQHIPQDFLSFVGKYNSEKKPFLKFLINQIGEIPLEGRDGLLRKIGIEMGGKFL